MEYSLLYATTTDKKTAESIGSALVKEKLAACVNIVPSVLSLYEWEGKMMEEKEILLFAKTRKSLVPNAIKRIKSLHPYSCPAILAIPIEGGYEPFLHWIAESTEREKKKHKAQKKGTQ